MVVSPGDGVWNKSVSLVAWVDLASKTSQSSSLPELKYLQISTEVLQRWQPFISILSKS
jgi:hypothetical protein